ncbi:MAG: outer membrane protein assembly factor BamA [Candidatus Marinimicrobia bacterium]|nr:outer membrane protein assembly factor BamA [Candidatus Neomarinimicrobiota bacterium]
MRILGHIILYFLTAVILFSAPKEKTFKVKDVQFNGNKAFSSSSLNKVILNRPSKLLQPIIYQDEIFIEDLASIKRHYNRRGFLEMGIPNYSVKIDSSDYLVSISINIDEGPQTLLDIIQLNGNHSLSDSSIMAKVKLTSGDPLDVDIIELSRQIITRLYADQGYLNTDVKTESELRENLNSASLNFNITEGIQYKIGTIEIEGLEKTRPYVIRREINLEQGQFINYSEILQNQRKIYLLGLFESVFIEPRESATQDSSIQDLVVKVKEVEAGSFNVSVGYGSVDRMRAQLQFVQNNLKGTSNKLGSKAKISSIQRLVELSYTNPRIRGSLWRADLNLRRERLFQPSYELLSHGLRMAARRNLDKNLSITLSTRNEINELSEIKVDTTTGGLAANVHSFNLRFTYDSRDNLFNPKQGIYLEWSNEIAGGPITSSNNFLKSVLRLRYFKSILKESTLGTAVEIGRIFSRNQNTNISLQERFYAGGPNSLRGFRYQEIGPLDSKGYPQGGLILLIWNVAELRYPLYKSLQGSAFVDVGNAWFDIQSLQEGILASDAGLGLNYNTALGVIRFDVAIPLGNVMAKDRIRFNLSMGYAF